MKPVTLGITGAVDRDAGGPVCLRRTAKGVRLIYARVAAAAQVGGVNSPEPTGLSLVIKALYPLALSLVV